MRLFEQNNLQFADLAGDGFSLVDDRNVNDLIGVGYGQDIDWYLLPVSDLAPTFLNLKSGLLGTAFQKFVNYNMRVAFTGDISTQMAESTALTDFIRETNAQRRLVFVADLAGLMVLLGD